MHNPFERNDIITTIDIGTTKICVIVAQINTNGTIIVKGVGKALCNGLKKGVVVDIQKTVDAITAAVAEAEITSNIPIEKAIIGISGSHIQSHSSSGMTPIKNGIISHYDIQKALAAAQAISLPQDQQILHLLPRYFTIDNKEVVQDPLGMSGTRLEVETHIITGSINSVKNLITCCEQAHIQVTDIILEQIASGHAVLSSDERSLGACIIDIGGGTTDVAIYYHNAIYHTHVIPIAGNHFTHDLAIGLRTTQKAAETIKKDYGVVFETLVDQEKIIEIEQVQENDRQVILELYLYNILKPRAAELLRLINKNLDENHLKPYMNTGLVLTGGGSLLNGIQELAETIFKMPVRIGRPHTTFNIPPTLNSPTCATGYGMIIYTLQKNNYETQQRNNASLNPLQIFNRMKHWISDLF